MKRFPVIAAGAFVVLLALAFWRERANSEAIGRWQEIAKRLQADSAATAASIRRTDSVFSRDTLRLRITETRYVRARDTILAHLTDTVRVREFVTAADSTVAACRAVVATCEQRVAARDSLIAVLGRQRQSDRSLFRARLALADPRLSPYAEALVDPLDTQTLVGRAGLEMKVVTRIRLVAGAQYTTTGDHQLRPLVGVKIRF